MIERNDQAPRLPRWLPLANRFVRWLQRRGVKTGTIHVLEVPGRRTGEMRSTPVSMVPVDGQRYLVGGHETLDWVRNAEAAGWGVLHYGGDTEDVKLASLPVEERRAILRAFPTEVPHGVPFFTRLYGVGADPDEFATLADRCPVFGIEPAG